MDASSYTYDDTDQMLTAGGMAYSYDVFSAMRSQSGSTWHPISRRGSSGLTDRPAKSL